MLTVILYQNNPITSATSATLQANDSFTCSYEGGGERDRNVEEFSRWLGGAEGKDVEPCRCSS